MARAHPRGERLVSGRLRPGRSFRPGFTWSGKQIIARHELKLASGKDLPKTKNPPLGGHCLSIYTGSLYLNKNPTVAVRDIIL
jgi:hypothetical protein